MTKNEVLIKLAQHIMDTRLKPVLDRSIEMGVKPIPVDTSLYENDYLEFKAKQEHKLVHIKNI